MEDEFITWIDGFHKYLELGLSEDSTLHTSAMNVEITMEAPEVNIGSTYVIDGDDVDVTLANHNKNSVTKPM